MDSQLPSRFEDIGKDNKEVKLTPLGVYVDQKTLGFPGLIVFWRFHFRKSHTRCDHIALLASIGEAASSY